MHECPRCHAPIEPGARFCAACGQPLEPAAAPAPPEPVGGAYFVWEPGPSATTGTPWDRRSEIGLPSALIETTTQVLSKPARFYRAMPPAGGMGGPLLYGVIVGYIGLLAASIYDAIFRSLMGGGSFGAFGRNEEL